MKIIRTVTRDNIFFSPQEVEAGNLPSHTEGNVINIFDEIEYQKIIGFGGAFTESAAYVYSLLSDEQKREFLEKYFDRDQGIGYNFGRTHINSCDFSLDIYTYVDDGDMALESFSIERDKRYIIPFIKDAMRYCHEPIMLFASPWSPPAYMKDNESAVGGGKIKEEYKEAWARYYVEYIKAFRREGIEIAALTVQNEPIAKQRWESCYYSPEDERDFIGQYLMGALDGAGLSDIKIIIWDHNKERVYDRARNIFTSAPVRDRVWGVAHHWYSGDHFDGMRLVHEQFGKVLISSENCGSIGRNPDVHALAERYGKEICEDINHFTAAYCDWNLLLSHMGGPLHNRSQRTVSEAGVIHDDLSAGCYAPVMYHYEEQRLIYTPIYYYIGHFSKFVQRGATRIATTKYTESIYVCAFKNPDGSTVAVMINTADGVMPAVIRYHDVCTKIDLAAHSIVTVMLEEAVDRSQAAL